MRQSPVPIFLGRILLLFVLNLIVLPVAYAEPYYAVMADAACSHCHLNPTGGGMRNDHGVFLYSEFPLRSTEGVVSEEFKGRVNKFLALGGDLKVQNLSTIEAPRGNSFTIPEGTLYVAADPVSHLTLYADTDLANVSSREVFGLVHNLPAEIWIKFGRINLPYGLRLPDDTAFIRGDLGFTFTTQDIGVEVGAEPGPFTLAVGVTNGVGGGGDNNSAKAVSWLSEWRPARAFRLGGSFYYNDALTTRLLSGGGRTGVHWGPVAILGEFDIQGVRNKTTGIDRTVLAGYGEADWLLFQGLDLKAIYEAIDDELAGSGRHHRISGGIEIFPIRNLKTQLLYRARIGPGVLGQDQILLLTHGYF